MTIAVYTAISNGYDTLKPHPYIPGVSWHAFVDKPHSGMHPSWNLHRLPTTAYGPALDHKLPKLFPSTFLPDFDLTLWIDGSVTILDPEFVLNAFNAEMTVFRHPERSDIMREAVFSTPMPKYAGLNLWEQANSYQEDGHPANFGLWACGIIARRRWLDLDLFNASWWAEIVRWGVQDQISFADCVRRLRPPLAEFPGGLYDGTSFTVDHRHG